MMFCPKCGRENKEDANFCEMCGEALNNNMSQSPNQQPVSQTAYQSNYNVDYSQKPINNYMALSILTTIFCCIPFGIVAIVYSSKASKLLGFGDIQGAIEASKKAKMWGIIALVCGVIFWLIHLIFVILIVANATTILDNPTMSYYWYY